MLRKHDKKLTPFQQVALKKERVLGEWTVAEDSMTGTRMCRGEQLCQDQTCVERSKNLPPMTLFFTLPVLKGE